MQRTRWSSLTVGVHNGRRIRRVAGFPPGLGRHLRGQVATGFAIVGHLQGPLEQVTMSIMFVVRQRGLYEPVILRAVVIVSVSNG